MLILVVRLLVYWDGPSFKEVPFTLEGVTLEYQSAHLNYFSLSDHILWDSFKQVSVEEDISSPEILGYGPSSMVSSFPPRILNLTISWSVHVFLSLVSSSFFVNT